VQTGNLFKPCRSLSRGRFSIPASVSSHLVQSSPHLSQHLGRTSRAQLHILKPFVVFQSILNAPPVHWLSLTRHLVEVHSVDQRTLLKLWQKDAQTRYNHPATNEARAIARMTVDRRSKVQQRQIDSLKESGNPRFPFR